MPSLKLSGRKSRKPSRINPFHLIYSIVAFVVVFAIYSSVQIHNIQIKALYEPSTPVRSKQSTPTPPKQPSSTLNSENEDTSEKATERAPVPRSEEESSSTSEYSLPVGFQSILERAKQFQGKCESQQTKAGLEKNAVDLPSFGIVEALSNYQPQTQVEKDAWQCEVPPATECDIERFSVVFLGYGDDRLYGVRRQIRNMLGQSPYKDMVEEVILVWNNPKPLNESGNMGSLLYEWSTRKVNPFNDQEPNRFRVFFPIEHGFPSSLLNRYHPMIKPKSRALLYYDDDGPFYSEGAIRSNFELWKRNSNAQTGAMSRAFTLSPRQQEEKDKLLGGPYELDDRKFISHCRDQGDEIGYDYRYFENFHANMVLPSGSMIHRNYLCFIWHPSLASLRKFVLDHLVHPDDMTVSTIVSHVSGRAPKPYSRRLPGGGRRLTEEVNTTSPEGMWRTKDWGKLRSIALNSVISFFGSINSGSYGWCYKTEYHKRKERDRRHICDPEIARVGMLPWMEKGGYGNDLCRT